MRGVASARHGTSPERSTHLCRVAARRFRSRARPVAPVTSRAACGMKLADCAYIVRATITLSRKADSTPMSTLSELSPEVVAHAAASPRTKAFVRPLDRDDLDGLVALHRIAFGTGSHPESAVRRLLEE